MSDVVDFDPVVRKLRELSDHPGLPTPMLVMGTEAAEELIARCADHYIRRMGEPSTVFGIDILVDERLEPDCWVLVPKRKPTTGWPA